MKVSDQTEDEAAADYMHHGGPGISGRRRVSIMYLINNLQNVSFSIAILD